MKYATPKNRGRSRKTRGGGGSSEKQGGSFWQVVVTFKEAVPPPPPGVGALGMGRGGEWWGLGREEVGEI